MVTTLLSVRSARARELAHQIARREKRSIADVVERALEAYELRQAAREPVSAFYARLSGYAAMVAMSDGLGGRAELDAIIDENRKWHSGVDL